MRKIFLDINKLNTEFLNNGRKYFNNFSGKVNIENPSDRVIIFNETIKWKNENSLLINSKNIYRWTFLETGIIKLEHLRFGIENPVFLVELIKSGENKWKSQQPHKCDEDFYSAELYFEKGKPVLYWTVKGPTENYSLKTVYATS